MPWADLVLFAVIGSLIVLWWLNPTLSTAGRPSSTPLPTFAPTPDLAWLALPEATGESGTPLPPTATLTPLPPTATTVPTPVKYKVVSGDSVGLIAEKFGVKSKDLVTLNGIPSNLFIVPGQELLIPGSGAPVPPTVTPTPTGGTLIYTIKQGDTIFGLAEDFHTSVDLILQANNMKLDGFLGVGQHLLIPLSADTPQPTPTTTGTPPPPTFTPQVGFRAPLPLTPPDGSQFTASDQVLLTWTSVGLLNEDEWYLLLVRPDEKGGAPILRWTKSTSWRLSPGDRPSAKAGDTYSWQVQVVRGRPDQPGSHPAPASAPSAARRFEW